jgi:hypothetical protein
MLLLDLERFSTSTNILDIRILEDKLGTVI